MVVTIHHDGQDDGDPLPLDFALPNDVIEKANLDQLQRALLLDDFLPPTEQNVDGGDPPPPDDKVCGDYDDEEEEGECVIKETFSVPSDDNAAAAAAAPPIHEVNQQGLDAEITKAMNSLSLKQRDEALYDIHGVADVVHETPVLVQKSLQDLDRYIRFYQRHRERHASLLEAYCLAESQDPNYVRREEIRLQFLRGKQFQNIKEVCLKIFHHFQVKRELFGDALLTKDITLRDLNDDDMISLNNGHIQILPVCDTAGRYTTVCFLPRARFKTLANLARAMWYTFMSIVDMSNPEAQNKGLVCVVNNMHARRHLVGDKSFPRMIQRIRMAAPMRMCSLHLCTDCDPRQQENEQSTSNNNKSYSASMTSSRDGSKRKITSLFLEWVRAYYMEKSLQIRTRVHRCNTHAECMESLAKFGIPVHVFPLRPDLHSLKRERHKAWLESRQVIEEARRNQQQQDDIGINTINNNNGVETTAATQLPLFFMVPSQSDVLLGRGKASQTHVGNLRLRILLEDHLDEYNNNNSDSYYGSHWGGKLDLSMEIVYKIQSWGGHFLKFQTGLWRIVSDREACQKVAHDFRTLCSQISKKEKIQQQAAKLHHQTQGDAQRCGSNQGAKRRKP